MKGLVVHITKKFATSAMHMMIVVYAIASSPSAYMQLPDLIVIWIAFRISWTCAIKIKVLFRRTFKRRLTSEIATIGLFPFITNHSEFTEAVLWAPSFV